jgi:hypothetical protein
MFLIISHRRSPTRLGYRELGIKLVSIEENYSLQPKKAPMVKEKRDDREGDPFNMFLEESLVQQRNKMMENFTQILQIILMETVEASSTSIHFGGATLFKIQVNYYIPLFEDQIYVNALEKWLNLLEGYCSFQKNSNSENITFILLKSLPHVRAWGDGYWDRYIVGESTPFGREPTCVAFLDALREDFYPVEKFDDQYMRWTTLHQNDQTISKYTNIFHTL